jgi:predicted enzyme related to lactoylglutathione lyase
MGAPVAWFEITSHDPDRSKAFYRQLFDWTISDSPDPGYALVKTGAGEEAIGGGIGATQSPDDAGGVTVYVKVDDLQAYLDKAETLGAETLVPPTDLPGDFGRFAMLADPDGHTVGLWS